VDEDNTCSGESDQTQTTENSAAEIYYFYRACVGRNHGMRPVFFLFGRYMKSTLVNTISTRRFAGCIFVHFFVCVRLCARVCLDVCVCVSECECACHIQRCWWKLFPDGD